MWDRVSVFENLIGDLEYHPKRAVVYLVLGVAALCVWIFAPSETKSTVFPIVFAVGGLALFLKGTFLLRRTSDGLGNSRYGLGVSKQADAELPGPSIPKTFPSIPAVAAQIIQDFGAGAILVGPLLHIGNSINDSRDTLPSLPVFITGATLFLIGWVIRRFFIRPLPE